MDGMDDKNDPEFALYSTTAEAYRAGRVEGARLMQEKCAETAEWWESPNLIRKCSDTAEGVAAAIRALKPEDV